MIKLTLVALTVAKAAAQVMTYENAPADGLTQGKAEKIWGSSAGQLHIWGAIYQMH